MAYTKNSKPLPDGGTCVDSDSIYVHRFLVPFLDGKKIRFTEAFESALRTCKSRDSLYFSQEENNLITASQC